MKKKSKVLALIFIASVILIFSLNIVSASLFGDIGNWPDNPEVAAGVIQENRLLISPLGRVVGCGDSLIMLGAEEKLRRITENLAHYLTSSVSVNDIPWSK